jgi:hypothetical protein
MNYPIKGNLYTTPESSLYFYALEAYEKQSYEARQTRYSVTPQPLKAEFYVRDWENAIHEGSRLAEEIQRLDERIALQYVVKRLEHPLEITGPQRTMLIAQIKDAFPDFFKGHEV